MANICNYPLGLKEEEKVKADDDEEENSCSAVEKFPWQRLIFRGKSNFKKRGWLKKSFPLWLHQGALKETNCRVNSPWQTL